MGKTIKEHSDSYFGRGFLRYTLISSILDSDTWPDLDEKVRKLYGEEHPDIMRRMFNEFKLYNCVLNIEYAITNSLNYFFIEEGKIKEEGELWSLFVEKIKRNTRSNTEEAEQILKEEAKGEIKNILTPHIMLYCAGFGIGEFIDYINRFTDSFSQKTQLITDLVEFNRVRKLVIHNLITSRENVEKEIENGILVGKQIIELIDNITSNKIDESV